MYDLLYPGCYTLLSDQGEQIARARIAPCACDVAAVEAACAVVSGNGVWQLYAPNARLVAIWAQGGLKLRNRH